MVNNSKTRFSDRVENYVKFRPHYPPEIIKYLNQKGILAGDSVIADIGSGTGISSELFLNEGNSVYGIEPNKEMREAAEKLFAGYWNFKSINGSAEATTLPDNSVDLIVSGQAFHWFEVKRCMIEFKRILWTRGYVVLMWNKRIRGNYGFQGEYEKLLMKYGTDYKEVGHQNLGLEGIEELFRGRYEKAEFDNNQIFDFPCLKGRLLSSSYAPVESDATYKPMIEQLREIFDNYQKDGVISFDYVTEIYTGRLR